MDVYNACNFEPLEMLSVGNSNASDDENLIEAKDSKNLIDNKNKLKENMENSISSHGHADFNIRKAKQSSKSFQGDFPSLTNSRGAAVVVQSDERQYDQHEFANLKLEVTNSMSSEKEVEELANIEESRCNIIKLTDSSNLKTSRINSGTSGDCQINLDTEEAPDSTKPDSIDDINLKCTKKHFAQIFDPVSEGTETIGRDFIPTPKILNIGCKKKPQEKQKSILSVGKKYLCEKKKGLVKKIINKEGIFKDMLLSYRKYYLRKRCEMFDEVCPHYKNKLFLRKKKPNKAEDTKSVAEKTLNSNINNNNESKGKRRFNFNETSFESHIPTNESNKMSSLSKEEEFSQQKRNIVNELKSNEAFMRKNVDRMLGSCILPQELLIHENTTNSNIEPPKKSGEAKHPDVGELVDITPVSEIDLNSLKENTPINVVQSLSATSPTKVFDDSKVHNSQNYKP